MKNIKNILKVSLLFFVMFIFYDVDAKAITSSYNYLDSTTLNYVQNIYEREEYKYGLLSTELEGTNYNYITYYYLCLTNDEIDSSSALSSNAKCDTFYRFHRQNNNYYIDKLEDDELKVSNSIFYIYNSKNYIIVSLLFIMAIIMTVSLLYFCLKDLF